VRFQEAVHLIPRWNSKRPVRLRNCKLLRANSLVSERLQSGAGKLVRIRGDLASRIIWYFETHLHDMPRPLLSPICYAILACPLSKSLFLRLARSLRQPLR
jgi:hypothetical protein